LIDEYGNRPLCIGGGCGLNVQINSRLLNDGVVERLYVPPACSDCGLSSGAALYYYHSIYGGDFNGLWWHDPYAGTDIMNKELLAQFEPLKFHKVLESAAPRLANGEIAAWCQGRSEIGPRALGNRSILADPRREDMKDIINKRIKRRQYWRPFAPVCLEEDASEWFEIDHPQPYMLEAPMVRREKASTIPAVVHADGSSRLQTVNKWQNRRLYRLLSEFKKLTGVPILLNTSLNRKGYPICNDVKIVLDLLDGTSLDFAVVGNYLIP